MESKKSITATPHLTHVERHEQDASQAASQLHNSHMHAKIKKSKRLP
jgi:hypothetical protein